MASEPTEWVVFRMGTVGKSIGQNAVCTRPEWDEMESARPGHNVLIRDSIKNEGEAERLARQLQTPIEPPKVVKPRPPRPIAMPLQAAPTAEQPSEPTEV